MQYTNVYSNKLKQWIEVYKASFFLMGGIVVGAKENNCFDCGNCRHGSEYSPLSEHVCELKNVVLGVGYFIKVIDKDCTDFKYKE